MAHRGPRGTVVPAALAGATKSAIKGTASSVQESANALAKTIGGDGGRSASKVLVPASASRAVGARAVGGAAVAAVASVVGRRRSTTAVAARKRIVLVGRTNPLAILSGNNGRREQRHECGRAGERI